MDLRILEIASHTENNKVLENFTHKSKNKNPLCGDEMEMTPFFDLQDGWELYVCTGKLEHCLAEMVGLGLIGLVLLCMVLFGLVWICYALVYLLLVNLSFG